MLVAEVGLDGCGLWFGEAMVDTVLLQRGSADMNIGTTPSRDSLHDCAEHAVFAG